MNTPIQPDFSPLSKHSLREEASKELSWINHEFIHGVDFLKTYGKSITFFGSARLGAEDKYYEKARYLGARISKELGYAIVTGGGPGIMEAGNRGAHEVNGHSLGLTIKLPTEQVTNQYVTDELGFYYFFSRKVILALAAEAYVYFPGGYGTLDELFEILTLVQNNKIERVPIILVGTEFWAPVDTFIKEYLFKKYGTITEADTTLYTITDDDEVVIDLIKKAPVRK